MDIVGLGLATIDVMTMVPRLPGRDEVFRADRILLEGGGPVATALVAAARLGASTAYLGPFAGTTWGVLARSGLDAEGVDTGHAPTRTQGEQPVSVILVDGPSGLRSILHQPGDVADLTPGEVPAALIASARALHLDGVHPEAALRAALVAREAGVPVSFDGGAGEIWPGVQKLLPFVDLLVVAHRFAELYTGCADPLDAGPALLNAYQPQQVIITAGVQGSWYWDRDRHFHTPAFAVDVVDTTGAGDVYHGAHLYAFLQGWSPQRALAFASAAAALKCRRAGGRAGIPALQQVEDVLNRSMPP